MKKNDDSICPICGERFDFFGDFIVVPNCSYADGEAIGVCVDCAYNEKAISKLTLRKSPDSDSRLH